MTTWGENRNKSIHLADTYWVPTRYQKFRDVNLIPGGRRQTDITLLKHPCVSGFMFVFLCASARPQRTVDSGGVTLCTCLSLNYGHDQACWNWTGRQPYSRTKNINIKKSCKQTFDFKKRLIEEWRVITKWQQFDSRCYMTGWTREWVALIQERGQPSSSLGFYPHSGINLWGFLSGKMF